MRLFFGLLGMLAVLSGGFAQNLDYAVAPQEFLGYAFGAQETAVAEALTAAGTPFRHEAVRAGQALTKLVLTNQTLDKLDRATVELQFYRGSLYLISATVPYAADSLQALRNVLTAKYGAVKSNDGGYHYNWFFLQKGRPAGNQAPDFAIVLGNDPVTKKTVTLVYSDNLRKSQLPPPGAANPPAAAEPAPTPAPDLDPSRF